MTNPALPSGRVATGIPGLDQILHGGVPQERIYLVHGAAGTGKTTLGFQFLLEGVRRGQKVLYVTLLQNRVELEDIAASHGWSLDGVDILELPTELRDGQSTEQTVFSPADIELTEAVDAILDGIDQFTAHRVVIDSISELSILVNNPYQLRRQILRLKYRLSEIRSTALLTAGDARESLTPLLTLVQGVIALSFETPVYGRLRRKLEVTKMRGMSYSSGLHDFRIRAGGLEVFPQVMLSGRPKDSGWDVVSSGIGELDTLLGGGLEKGTSCLITGTTGAGKSTLATLYMQAAAERADRSTIFCFDERTETFLRRSRDLDLGLEQYVDQGLVDLRQVNVGELSPGEFLYQVAKCVEKGGAEIVVIDSLSGYLKAMPEERLLVTQLHELLAYLNSKGVLAIMLLATHGLFGMAKGEIDASYIADTVVLARHFEADGSLRRCISVLKKRHGNHEKTIREFDIDRTGIHIGPPLKGFSGLLTGVPSYQGGSSELLDRKERGKNVTGKQE